MRHVPSGQISGRVVAPPSKSMMQRAVLAASLARGLSRISNPTFCSDGLASMRVAEGLGAGVEREVSGLKIEGGMRPHQNLLNCGESGLCFRVSCALASLSDTEISVTAEGSLLKREQSMVTAPLKDLGVRCESSGNLPPLLIQGPLRGGKISLNAASSSQFLSGLLMALPLCKEDSIIRVEALKSSPYIAMSLELLESFGVHIDAEPDFTEFRIKGAQHYTPCEYTVEGDWSGASFFIVAAALHGDIQISGLRRDSKQADRALIRAIEDTGAELRWEGGDLFIRRRELKPFTFDATDCPDLFPPLVALASFCNGVSRIKGISRLSGKESNRALTLQSEFMKFGTDLRLEGDWMEVKSSQLKSGSIDSHNDHRIAMASAIAACGIKGGADIEGEECVAKSFPDFFEVLGSIVR